MAISVGTVTNVAKVFGNNRTVAHVTDVADNRILLAWIWNVNIGHNVTVCTYNGVAMTELIDMLNPGGNDVRVHMYYMIAPPEGNLNFHYTLAGNCTHACSVQAWAGVNPDDPFGVPITDIGNTNLITATVGSAANEVVVDGGALVDTAASVIALGAGQTQLTIGQAGGGLDLGHG